MIKFYMDKKSKEIIQEAVKDIIKFRKEEFSELIDISFSNNEASIKKNISPMYHNKRTLTKYFKTIMKLNKLLKEQDRIDIAEEMKKIQVKKYITVKEFAEKYNISVSSQKGLRARLNDPLPFLQNKEDGSGNKIVGGKITYDVEEIEKWMDNNYR